MQRRCLHPLSKCNHWGVMKFSNASRNDHVIIQGNISKGGHGIKVGDYAQVKRIFSNQQVQEYGQLISDNNPIHQEINMSNINKIDDHNKTSSSNVIVHGMLSASLFSSIFGTLIPGSLYRSQNLIFHTPVYSNEYVVGKVQVTKIKDLRRGLLVTCDTTAYQRDLSTSATGDNGDIEKSIKCIQGNAEVWLPGVKVSH